MTNAVFYLTYNGVFNNTNGIGTQTRTFLSGMEQHHAVLAREFGDFNVHLIAPVPNERWWGYSPDALAYAHTIARRLGGGVHFCPYLTGDDDFWSAPSWLAISTAAAAIVLEWAQRYDRLLVIANDIPFLHAPGIIARARGDFGVDIQSLIALYGSSYIHTPRAIDAARLGWERTGLTAASAFPSVFVGDVGAFLSGHFTERFGVPPARFAPYRSSLNLSHPDFAPLDGPAITAVLRKHGIPEDRPLVLAFGRADWIKGFDVLLGGLDEVRERVHLVLNVVPYEDDAPILHSYRDLITRQRLSASLLVGYSRELPRALSQWPNTRVVVCPSRGEPLSNVPFEVSLWAREAGPVLLCADRDGYREQVEDGVNGFLFAADRSRALARQIGAILDLDAESLCTIRRNAYDKVMRERDFGRNFRDTLAFFWRR